MVETSSDVEFGAFGLEVIGTEVVDGEVVVRVQSLGGERVSCAGCGRRARCKGRRSVTLRDAPSDGGRPRRVVWVKRVWVCPDLHCDVGSWTERGELVEPRRVLTGRAVRWAVHRLRAVEGSVVSLARRLGVGWSTVWAQVDCVAERVAIDAHRADPVAKLGLDETVMASATRCPRRRFITAAVDADTGRIIDVFEGQDAADLRLWATQQPRQWTRAVEVVCIDPHEGYRSAVKSLRDSGCLGPHARIAVDPFHIVRLANQALTRCRQRTQNQTLGHRGRARDPLYGIRKLLLTGAGRLDV